jgi:hypothetical protein
MRTQVQCILNSGNPVATHHFINLFEQLIVVKQPEFAFIIVTLYNEWRIRSGEGHKLGIMRLLNKIDADVRRINKNVTDLVSGEYSTVLALKAQIADLKKQMVVNLAKTNTLEEQNFAFAAARHGGDNHRNRDFNRNKGRNNGGAKRKFPNWPKKEDKQTCIVDGETYV